MSIFILYGSRGEDHSRDINTSISLGRVVTDMGKSMPLDAVAVQFLASPPYDKEKRTNLTYGPGDEICADLTSIRRKSFFIDDVLHLQAVTSYDGRGYVEDLGARWLECASQERLTEEMLLNAKIVNVISATDNWSRYEVKMIMTMNWTTNNEKMSHFVVTMTSLVAGHKPRNLVLYPSLAMKRQHVLRNVKMAICTLMRHQRIANGSNMGTFRPSLQRYNTPFMIEENQNSSIYLVGPISRLTAAILMASDRTAKIVICTLMRHQRMANESNMGTFRPSLQRNNIPLMIDEYQNSSIYLVGPISRFTAAILMASDRTADSIRRDDVAANVRSETTQFRTWDPNGTSSPEDNRLGIKMARALLKTIEEL